MPSVKSWVVCGAKQRRDETHDVNPSEGLQPEGFQICINAEEKLPKWSNNINPAGGFQQLARLLPDWKPMPFIVEWD